MNCRAKGGHACLRCNTLIFPPIVSYNGPNLVLKYDKQRKRLVNIAVDDRYSPFYALRDRQGNAIGVTACDIDGDGREEIYVLNTNNAFSGTVQADTNANSLYTLTPWLYLFYHTETKQRNM